MSLLACGLSSSQTRILRLQRRQIQATYVESIARDGPFDAAICMGNTFGYLDLSGTRAFVAALAVALRPGGGLVIDYAAAAESVLPGFVDHKLRHISVGDITVTGSNTYDLANSKLLSRYAFSSGEQPSDRRLSHFFTFTSPCGQLAKDMAFVGPPCMAGVAFAAAVKSPRLQLRSHELGVAPTIGVGKPAGIEHHDIHQADGTGIDHVVLSRQAPKLGHEDGAFFEAPAAQALHRAFVGVNVVHAAEAFKTRAFLDDLGLHVAPGFVVGRERHRGRISLGGLVVGKQERGTGHQAKGQRRRCDAFHRFPKRCAMRAA